MNEKISNIIKHIFLCSFLKHRWEWVSGIGNLHGDTIDDDYKCMRCFTTKTIHHFENECNCKECTED